MTTDRWNMLLGHSCARERGLRIRPHRTGRSEHEHLRVAEYSRRGGRSGRDRARHANGWRTQGHSRVARRAAGRSTRTVPAPVRMAELRARHVCTSARACSPLIQRRPPPAGAVRASRLNRELQADPRAAALESREEPHVECRVSAHGTDRHGNLRALEPLHARASHQRIRMMAAQITRRMPASISASRTGRRAPVMTAGLERDIRVAPRAAAPAERSAATRACGLSGTFMPAFAEQFGRPSQHATHARIGIGGVQSARGERQRSLHVLRNFVARLRSHLPRSHFAGITGVIARQKRQLVLLGDRRRGDGATGLFPYESFHVWKLRYTTQSRRTPPRRGAAAPP